LVSIRILVAAGALIGLAATAQAAVTPASFEATLKPGESAQVTKTVDVPEVPRSLDLMLIVDLTGSYADDLPRIKALAPGIFDAVRAISSDSRFGLATHVDFPFGSWGVAGEWGYRLEQQLTSDRATWLGAINAMRSLYGNDGPESQYEALYQAVTGAGRQMPPTTDGDYDDPGEIKPGQNASLRTTAVRVFAITTDSEFHVGGDGGGPFPYPGPSRNQVIDALNAQTVRVVAIKAPGSTGQMDDVANATRGAITSTGSTSEEIAQAITSGLTTLNFNVHGVPEDCAPLEVTFDPASRDNVPGGTSVTFQETIKVPAGVTAADLPADGVINCRVRYRAGLGAIGTQQIRIKVELNKPPECSGVQADTRSLWPANHKLQLVTLSGATDPDGDTVTLTVKGVTQDEPLNGTGDGDAAPDAATGTGPNSVQLRSERSGSGDGRVYKISFEASDGRGGTCTGTTTVSVPKSQATAANVIDSGLTVNSFGG
jgi:hypothetical protein